MKTFESPEFRNKLAKVIKQAPKEERRGILEKALEEGQDLEIELTPEQVEKIMEKVQDINAMGTVHHQINYEGRGDLKGILSAGLLGSMDENQFPSENLEERKTRWVKAVRKGGRHRMPPVFTQMDRRKHGEMGVIVDTSGFREHEFINLDDEIKPRTGSHIGNVHVIYSRISPRLFRGIYTSDATDEKVMEDIVRVMLNQYKNKLDLLLPVYDTKGNLLWPRQIVYEEVKKFVAEREERKKDD